MEDEPPEMPTYPRLGGREASYEQRHRQQVWEGEPRRLIKLQEYLQDALERVFNDSVAKLGPMPLDHDYGAHERAMGRVADGTRLRVTVRGKNGAWQHDGEIGEALETADDLRDVEQITMRNSPMGSVDAEVEVRLRGDYSDAVTATVRGSDQTWVDGVYEGLRQQLLRGSPWWAFMVNWWFGLLLAAMTSGAALVTLFILFPKGSLSEDEQSAYWALWSVGSFTLLWTVPWLMSKLLPKLQVLPHGQGSTGGRRLSVFLGVVAFMAANVIIPLVIAARQ